MSEKKTLAAWEKEKGFMVLGKVKPDTKMTYEQASELMQENGFLGVDHESRTQFLKDNGYEVSRENMVNTDLSAKPTEE